MGSYHQMGHNSWNLIPEDNLEQYSGMVLSPVNSDPEQVSERIESIENRDDLDIVLDPQFYIPSSARGRLPLWPYFNSACDTTDLSNAGWWKERCAQLFEVSKQVGVTSICSPAMLPKIYDAAYYDATVNCADELASMVAGSDLSVLLTTVVSFRDLAVDGASDRIASILTRSSINRAYVIFYDDLTARQQWTDSESLIGAMKLIGALEAAGMNVLVGYCGFDVVLWKYCGATSAATGKFLNLRRFGPERWLDDQADGRVVEYWTEPSLIAWLRENDVLQIQRRLPALLTAAPNPFSAQILTALGSTPRAAWRGLSWRQYLWWFAAIEAEIAADRDAAVQLLSRADANWAALDKAKLLLFDRENDGSWIRPWLNAIHSL